MAANPMDGGAVSPDVEAVYAQVIGELAAGEKFLLTTHENPDGDALGSLLGIFTGLSMLGKDVVMFMAPDEFPMPHEYRFLPLKPIVHEPPEDIAERKLVFLDCGNIDRMPVDFAQRPEARIINIDHHHDNTRFGDVNLVVEDASCTAEIVFDILRGLEVEITPTIAEALYVAMVTDTGRFMYENTTAHAHRVAAELIAAGVDPYRVFRRLYEGVPFAKLKLMARALGRVERYDDGALTLTRLLREDYDYANAEDSASEGVVDQIRAVDGTAVAALVRELEPADDGIDRRKVSLRATDGRVDVSVIAREAGGGGHRRAAGFTTDMPMDKLVGFLRREVQAQLG